MSPKDWKLLNSTPFAITLLEPSLPVLPADIGTVNPDRKRTIGSRKFVPALLAAAGIGPKSDCFV